MTNHYDNGINATDFEGVVWRKARASDAYNNCVEIARVAEDAVALRNSRFPEGPALVFTRAEIDAFLAGARGGEFDGMTV
ncbi:DUF397 domain-containing protein [Streptomyces sp. NPDC058674]|uniref:DUF397 domain-containing protein n=1 Tax=Streptomyces sp. NPDC058674 TaxID=3346592 RepID=UPI003666F728